MKIREAGYTRWVIRIFETGWIFFIMLERLKIIYVFLRGFPIKPRLPPPSASPALINGHNNLNKGRYYSYEVSQYIISKIQKNVPTIQKTVQSIWFGRATILKSESLRKSPIERTR